METKPTLAPIFKVFIILQIHLEQKHIESEPDHNSSTLIFSPRTALHSSSSLSLIGFCPETDRLFLWTWSWKQKTGKINYDMVNISLYLPYIAIYCLYGLCHIKTNFEHNSWKHTLRLLSIHVYIWCVFWNTENAENIYLMLIVKKIYNIK